MRAVPELAGEPARRTEEDAATPLDFGLEDGEQVLVDARGHRCPTPTLRLRRALAAAADGAVVVLLADDPMARIDVPHFAAATGHVLLDRGERDGVLRFSLRRGAGAGGGDRG